MPYNYKRKAPGVSNAGAYKRQKLRQGFVRRLAAAGVNAQPYRPVVYGRPSAPEIKGMDTALTIAGPVGTATNTNTDCIVLNLVQQGAGSWNRIGRKIMMKSLRLKGQINVSIAPNAVTLDRFGATVRMVVVYDKQPSGNAIPNFDTVFGGTDQSGTESSTILDNLKYDNMSRFRVLRDYVKEVNPSVVPTGGSTNLEVKVVDFDEYVKLPMLETVFSGQSNPMTIADISTGAVYVYFRSSIATSTTVQVSALSKARLRYMD